MHHAASGSWKKRKEGREEGGKGRHWLTVMRARHRLECSGVSADLKKRIERRRRRRRRAASRIE